MFAVGSPPARDTGEFLNTSQDPVMLLKRHRISWRQRTRRNFGPCNQPWTVSRSQLLLLANMARKSAQPTHAEKSVRLRSIVDEYLQFLLTEEAQSTYNESWHDLVDADSRDWSSIFSSLSSSRFRFPLVFVGSTKPPSCSPSEITNSSS